MTQSSSQSSPSAAPADERHPSRPIAVYLFVLALVALVPTFIFSAVLLQRNNEAQQRVVETLITSTARSIVQAVDREMIANITTLRVLASTPALLEGDLASFHARAREGLAGTGSFAYVLDKDLFSVMTTRTDYPSPRSASVDRESGLRALQSKTVVVSDLVFGRFAQRFVFNILLPVTPPQGDPMILGLSRDAETMATTLLADKLPQGWHVALLDGKAQVIASPDPTVATGSAFGLAGSDQLTSTGWSEVEVAGVPTIAIAERSVLTGWSLVAWAPRDVVTRPLSDAMWSLIIGGLLLATITILAIYGVSLRISRSVHRLEDDAALLGAGQAVPARNYPISEIANVSVALSEASHRRRAAEVEVRFLMRELAHRSKNQMTVIAAMAKQTARGADTVPEFVQSFERRIFGLARSTDLLLANGAAGVDLEELLARQIEPFCPVDGRRVTLSGPPIRLNMQSAQILGMAAHELATNAVKYGAFATETGTLRVAWTRTAQSVQFLWRETLPALTPRPDRKGFGTTVLENMVGRALGAEVRRTIHPDGIEWSFSVPVDALDPARDPQGETDLDRPAPPAPARPVEEK